MGLAWSDFTVKRGKRRDHQLARKSHVGPEHLKMVFGHLFLRTCLLSTEYSIKSKGKEKDSDSTGCITPNPREGERSSLILQERVVPLPMSIMIQER